MNTLFAYLIAFSLHLHPLTRHPRRPSPAFSRTIVLLHPSLCLRIHGLQFFSFRTRTAFDGLILPGFAQSQHSTVAVWQDFFSAFSHTDPERCSRIRSLFFLFFLFFYSFRSLSAFNGHILAGFAQSLHSTVAFWQLFLAPHSPTPRLPPILEYDHISAAFAQSRHSKFVFSQVLHNLCIRRSRFGTFSSLRILPPQTCPPFSHTIAFLQFSLTLSIKWSYFGRFCAISAFNGHVLAAFTLCILTPRTCFPFSHTIAFLQLSLTLGIQPLHFGRFCTIFAFDGRVLTGFAQSLHSTVAFWQLFLSPHSPTP